jgi:hypothetical protein
VQKLSLMSSVNTTPNHLQVAKYAALLGVLRKLVPRKYLDMVLEYESNHRLMTTINVLKHKHEELPHRAFQELLVDIQTTAAQLSVSP